MEEFSFAASAIIGDTKDYNKFWDDDQSSWPEFDNTNMFEFSLDDAENLRGLSNDVSTFDKTSVDSDAHFYSRSMVPRDSNPLCENGCEANSKHNDDSIGEYTLANFINDMPTDTKLSSKGPTDAHNLWVFWSEGGYPYEGPQTTLTCIGGSDHETVAKNGNEMIEENIKMALSNFILHSTGNILVQFWRPITVQGQLLLTTSNQPFGLRQIDRKLCEYRIHCKNYQFNVNEENLGVPGRVFLQRWPEFTPNVRYYSHKEYPQWECAESCSIRRSLVLPIFEPFGRGCVGVLEFVDSEIHSLFEDVMAAAHLALEVAKLESSYMYYHVAENRILEGEHSAAVKIHNTLEVVCKTHQLPLALYWQPCEYSNVVMYDMEKSCNKSESSCSEEVAYAVCQAYNDSDTFQKLDFLMSCKEHLIRKGQGIVGMALVDYKPRFCTDINQLSISNYPLAHYARDSGLTACFAICLHCTNTGNDDHVLEFFLPPYITDYGIQQAFLANILVTVKQNFTNFKVASKPGEELLGQPVDFSTYLPDQVSKGAMWHSIDAGQSNISSFSTYKTISTVASDFYSIVSESTLKSTSRKPKILGEPSSKRSRGSVLHVNEFGHNVEEQFVELLRCPSTFVASREEPGEELLVQPVDFSTYLVDQVSKVAMWHPIDAGQSDNSSFSTYKTISLVASDIYSLVSESTSKSTSRKPKLLGEPSSKRSRGNVLHVNEFGHNVGEQFVESLRCPSFKQATFDLAHKMEPYTPVQAVKILTVTANSGEDASSGSEMLTRKKARIIRHLQLSSKDSRLLQEKNSERNYHIQESNGEAASMKNGRYSGAEAPAKNNSEIPSVEIPSTVRTLVNPGSEHPVVELDASQSGSKSMHMEPNRSSVQSCKISKSRISLDDLKKCFGMTLGEAASSFEVSRSTFKRVCREHHIRRWPTRRRGGFSSSLSNGEKKSIRERIIESSDREISCSDPLPGEVEAVKPMQDASVVLINECELESHAGGNAVIIEAGTSTVEAALKHQSTKHLDGVGVDEVGSASETVCKDGERLVSGVQLRKHDYVEKNDACGAIVEKTVDPSNGAALTEQGEEGIRVNKFSHSDDCVDGDEVPRMDIALIDPPKQPEDNIGDPEMAEEVVVLSGAWRGHVVGFDYANLLHAVEEDHPATFASVQFRTEALWLSALNSLCEFLLKFLVAPINALSMEDMGSFQDWLVDLEGTYKFILDWARERLEKVKELRFGNPFMQELANLENRRASLLVQEEMLKEKLEHLQAELKVLDDERDAKQSAIYECLGEERMYLIAGFMGRGLLPSHQLQ